MSGLIPRPLRILCNLMAVSVIAWLAVGVLYAALELFLATAENNLSEVTPITATSLPRQDKTQKVPLQAVGGSVFNAGVGGETVPVVPGPSQQDNGAATATEQKLRVRLKGTVVGDVRSSRAVIEDLVAKKQALYAIDDTVQGAVVKEISRGRVVVELNGRRLVLLVEDIADEQDSSEQVAPRQDSRQSGAARAEPTRISVSREKVDTVLRNINQIIAEVKIEPHKTGNRVDGFAVSRIARGSFLEEMGFRNGDIVQQVNGESFTSMDDAVHLYEKYRDSRELSLLLMRKGRPAALEYSIR